MSRTRRSAEGSNSEDETGSVEVAIHRRPGERDGVWRKRGTERSVQNWRDMQ
jgi:hypothetical protein